MKDSLRIISVLSLKGGVGKTTQTFNFSHWLANQGYKILLIDNDYQCNLSSTFQAYSADYPENVGGFYADNFKDPKIIKDVSKNIDLIPGYDKLDSVPQSFGDEVMPEFKMETWMADHAEMFADYDYIFIDCHNDFNVLEKNAVAVSHHVLSLLEPGQYGLDSKEKIKVNLERFKTSAVDPRTRESFIDCDIIFAANKIAYNTSSSHELREMAEKDDEVVAIIPLRESFNRSTIERKSVFEVTDNSKKASEFKADLNKQYSALKQAIDKLTPEQVVDLKGND